MTEPTHLHPDTIKELAEAIAAVLRRRGRPPAPPKDVLFTLRHLYSTEVNTVCLSDVRSALEGRAEVTIEALLEALGIPVERRDHSVTCTIGKALASLGWRVSRRDGGGARARYYAKP